MKKGEWVRYAVYAVLSFSAPLAVLLPESIRGVLEIAPWSQWFIYAVLAVVVFAAWRLNRGRLTIAVAALLAVLLLDTFPTPEWGAWRPFAILGLPWGFAMLYLLREGAFLGLRGILRLVLFAVPFALLALVWEYAPGLYLEIRANFVWFFSPTTLVGMVVMAAILAFRVESESRDELLGLLLVSVPVSYLLAEASGDVVVPERFAAEAAPAVILAHIAYSLHWRMAYVDDLTGLRNRRALDELLRRLGGRFAVVMMDVDHFKHFNDKYGHEEGDNVLRSVATTLRSVFGDKVFRYGGEEFCAVLRRRAGDEARPYAERARKRVTEIDFRIRAARRPKAPPARFAATVRGFFRRGSGSAAGKRVPVTLSAGVAQRASRSAAPSEVVKAADTALYRAKKKGRNRVE